MLHLAVFLEPMVGVAAQMYLQFTAANTPNIGAWFRQSSFANASLGCGMATRGDPHSSIMHSIVQRSLA